MLKVYQSLYLNTDYGKADKNNCPTVYLFDKYREWLLGNIIELGCGNGDGVKFLRSKEYTIDGIDQVKLGNGMKVKDITKRIKLKKYETSLCIDVFEHILDDGIKGILKNMQGTRRQIISVHNRPASFRGARGEQLHINIKPFDEWFELISSYLKVMGSCNISDYSRIYFCES